MATAKPTRQIRQYDKILKENMEASLPGIMKHLLHIEAANTEELPDSIQHTKEREPDVLKKVTDRQGNTFVLQMELQLKNEPEMVYRMAEYYIMLSRRYKLPVRQYVTYIGRGKLTMPDKLKLDHLQFQYSLRSISSVNYHKFLQSEKPEEKILALLADFGKEDPASVVHEIVCQVKKASVGDLQTKKHLRQLHILSQLRNLASTTKDMQSLAEIWKDEYDPWYMSGLKEGIEKGNRKFVKNLLLADKFTIKEIASLAGVTQVYVKKVKKDLKK